MYLYVISWICELENIDAQKQQCRKKAQKKTKTKKRESQNLVCLISLPWQFCIFVAISTLLSETVRVTLQEQDLLIHTHNNRGNKNWYDSHTPHPPTPPHTASSCSLHCLTSAIDPLRLGFLNLRRTAGLHLLSLTLSAVNNAAAEKCQRLLLNLAVGPQQHPSRCFQINVKGVLKGVVRIEVQI